MFNDTQQQLIRSILKDMKARSKISADQRAAIRQCCVEARRSWISWCQNGRERRRNFSRCFEAVIAI